MLARVDGGRRKRQRRAAQEGWRKVAKRRESGGRSPDMVWFHRAPQRVCWQKGRDMGRRMALVNGAGAAEVAVVVVAEGETVAGAPLSPPK